MSRLLPVLTVVASVSLLTGCSQLETIQECARVIELINSSYDEIEALNQPPPTRQRYERITEAYVRLAQALKEQAPALPRLADKLKNYRKQLEEISKTTASYAESLEKNERRLAVLEAKMKSHRKRQERLTRRLNRICQPSN